MVLSRLRSGSHARAPRIVLSALFGFALGPSLPDEGHSQLEESPNPHVQLAPQLVVQPPLEVVVVPPLEVVVVPPPQPVLLPSASIQIAAPACLPVGDNGVVTATVTGDEPGSRVLVFFRRVQSERPDHYYVEARPVDEGVYRALLPKASPALGDSSEKSRLIFEHTQRLRAIAAEAPSSSPPPPSVALDPERLERLVERLSTSRFEPAEVYAELRDVRGQVGATSAAVILPVEAGCEVGSIPVAGGAENMVIGETAFWQAEQPPFHWECDGIQTREFRGRLFQDPICRDYFVPFEPRLKTMSQQVVLPGEATFRNVTVFYGTDRQRTGSLEPAERYGSGRGPLEVGTCEVTIPVDHEPGELESPSWFERPDPAKHILLLSVTPKSRSLFAGELAQGVAADLGREALVFVHGYNVSFENAARRTAQMASDLDFRGAAVMYSWPSQADLAKYPVDEANIRWTVPHLREFLDLVARQSGAQRIHLIAHSMGNRAMTEVLLRYAAEESLAPGSAPRFNQIALVAPDVDADVFREDIAPRIRPISERVTLYASANDKALKVSKGVHGHPRAGDLSSGIVVSTGVETIDASNVDTSLLAAIDLGHSYFAEQPTVIEDLKQLLAGRSPTERALAARSGLGGTYWVFHPPD